MVTIVRPPDLPIANPNRDIVLDCMRVQPVHFANHTFLDCIKVADSPVQRPPDPDPAQRRADTPVQRPNDSPIVYRLPDPPEPERLQ